MSTLYFNLPAGCFNFLVFLGESSIMLCAEKMHKKGKHKTRRGGLPCPPEIPLLGGVAGVA